MVNGSGSSFTSKTSTKRGLAWTDLLTKVSLFSSLARVLNGTKPRVLELAECRRRKTSIVLPLKKVESARARLPKIGSNMMVSWSWGKMGRWEGWVGVVAVSTDGCESVRDGFEGVSGDGEGVVMVAKV